MFQFPVIIQGGMGVGVSNWRLAQAVSRLGQLGVVSGTALDQVFVRRLADGDVGGHMRRALDAFPFPAIAQRLWQRFFIPGGKAAGAPYPSTRMHEREEPQRLIELCMAANFAEVFLAREGHGNPVGINFLEKVQLPHLASIYGAMLAGVGYVLMGAGIPLQVPAVLDAYAAGRPAEYKLTVAGSAANCCAVMRLDPGDYAGGRPTALERPRFLPIVSSHVLATTIVRRASGRVDGFVVEGPTAGGHNAPPRGRSQLSSAGEPVYGQRDQVDLANLRELGSPFWLAGGYGSPAKLREALDQGATGVQVGTVFALSEESGLRADLKAALLAKVRTGAAAVFTDPLASPTGFPFKVAQLEGSLAEAAVYRGRQRVCDLGFLRELYARPDGQVGYRCPAEPESCYLNKGGAPAEATGRKCLCNALLANIGLAQLRAGEAEPPLVTLGNGLEDVLRFLSAGQEHYSAASVIADLLDGETGPAVHALRSSPQQS